MPRIDPNNKFEKLFLKYQKYFKVFDWITKTIGAVVILLALIELTAFFIVAQPGQNSQQIKGAKTDLRVQSEIYQNKPWVYQYWQEHSESAQSEYYPYLGYRRVPNYHGDYINLDDQSIRKTLNPCLDQTKAKIKIFAMGGSTMWGTGARDHGTIPSFISALLCKEGFNVEVTNFGESGYTNSQEMIRLLLELRKGNIPNVVVFYDGINDVFASFQEGGAPGWPLNVAKRKKEFNSSNKTVIKKKTLQLKDILPNTTKLLSDPADSSVSTNLIVDRVWAKSGKNLADETVSVYKNNFAIVNALGKSFQFQSLWYWQPSICNKDHITQNEKLMLEGRKRFDLNKLCDFYRAVSNQATKIDGVIDLTGIFKHYKGSLYMDWMHVSEEGNLIIAQRMADDIIKRLK